MSGGPRPLSDRSSSLEVHEIGLEALRQTPFGAFLANKWEQSVREYTQAGYVDRKGGLFDFAQNEEVLGEARRLLGAEQVTENELEETFTAFIWNTLKKYGVYINLLSRGPHPLITNRIPKGLLPERGYADPVARFISQLTITERVSETISAEAAHRVGVILSLVHGATSPAQSEGGDDQE